MKINKAEGNAPFHGRRENNEHPEGKALAKAILTSSKAPKTLTAKVAPGASHPATERVAQTLFRANG